MSDVARKNELCIKVIRSHLISYPGGLTLRQLEDNYKKSERQELPYRNYGHTSLLSFLKSLPEVVRIDYRNGLTLLHGVADESSKHVKNLVDRQRRKPRARPPRFMAVPRHPVSNSFTARRVAVASESTRRNIFKLLQTQTSGIAVPAFLELFKNEVGTILDPERQGFRSLPEFFLSMPDVCRLECGRKDRYGNLLYIYPPKPAGLPPKTATTQHNNNSAPEHVQKTENYSKPEEKNTKKDAVEEREENVNAEEIKNSEAQSSVEKESVIKNDEDTLNIPVLPSCQLLKTEILEILSEKPQGVWAAQFSVLYKKKYNKELEIQKLGYFSIIEFLSTLSDEVSITRPNPKRDWLLVKRSKDSDLKKPALVRCRDENLPVTLMEIKELLLKSEDGITADKLFDTYERVYKHKIDLEECGEPMAAVNLAIKIEGVCICRERGKIIVALTEKQRKAMGCSENSSLFPLPTDGVDSDASYKLPQLPSSDVQYIDIFVADVTNPEYFTIQICGKETTGALNELMDNMERFYSSPEGDKYKFPEHRAKVGQICAAVFLEDLDWHRAVIVQVYDTYDYVDVLYVDYGSVSAVPITSLRLLKACFMLLPMQMVKARLAHLRPRNLTSWTLEARNCMLDMCRNRPLVGIITGIKNRVLSLCLCDTSNPDIDLHINDTLIENKHAFHFPDDLNNEEVKTLKSILTQQIKAEENEGMVDLGATSLSVLNYDKNDDMMNASSPTDFDRQNDHDLIFSKENLGNCQTAGPPLQHYIQKHSLVDGMYSLHVINYEGNPMVDSFEISRLFQQSSDVLRPLLLMNKLKFGELVIGNDEKHAALFEAIHKMLGTVENGVPRNLVCLYRLQDVPAIVDGLGHSNRNELVAETVKILADFDAKAKFWFVEGDSLKLDPEANSNVDELEKLNGEGLSAKRKIQIEQLANESNSKSIVTLEEKICGIKERMDEHSARPKELRVDSENNGLRDTLVNHKQLERSKELMVDSENTGIRDTLVNQYGMQLEPGGKEKEEIGQACAKSDTTKVAEVAPYINSSEKDVVDEDISIIPGAHIPHDIVDFTCRGYNAPSGSELPPLLVPGATGATNWGASQMQNVLVDQGTQACQVELPVYTSVPEHFSQNNTTFLPRQEQNNSLHVAQAPIRLSQWSCVQMPQPQVNGPQLFRDASGQVYVGQVGHPGGNIISMPQSSLMYTTTQGQSITQPIPLFMPVQGMHGHNL